MANSVWGGDTSCTSAPKRLSCLTADLRARPASATRPHTRATLTRRRRHGRPPRRAPWNPRAVPRLAGGDNAGILGGTPHGKFIHTQPAADTGAGRLQLVDDRGAVRRDVLSQNGGA